MDLSDMGLFNSSMLTPEQQGAVKSRALMSAGAALMKASGPSPYKNTAFSGIGSGVEGLLSGAQSGTDEALKQQLVRGQISQQQLAIMHAAAQYQGMGLPVPPELAQMLKALGLPQSAAQPGGGAPAAAPAPAVGAPGIAGAPGGGAPPMAPGGVPPMAPGGAPPNLGGAPGAPPMAPGAPPAPPMAPPAPAAPAGPPLPPSAAGLIRNLPTQDRYALIGGGPSADIVKDVTSKNAELTPGQKDARDPLVRTAKANEEQDKTDITGYQKLYAGLQAQGHTSATMMPNIQLAKSFINDPGFYSGTGESINLGYKRMLAALPGGDPNAPLPQEAFRKIMAANILHQIDDMKAAATEMGGTSSRIFASQIDMMEKAAQNPDNSIAANRFLTELADRSAKRNMEIADLAADYKQEKGRLDPAFEKTLRKHMVDKPMFTTEELKDVRKIAPAADAAAPAAEAPGPKKIAAGFVINGHRFKGGNPDVESSWEVVK